jgi:hypothetical protein
VTKTSTDPRQRLAALYRERLAVERNIKKAEGELALLIASGELPPQKYGQAVCGTESKYQRHIRKGIPFPEDFAQDPCGCRLAHRRYEAARAAAAKLRAEGKDQPDIFEGARS